MAYNSVRNSTVSLVSKHTSTVYKRETTRLDRSLFISVLIYLLFRWAGKKITIRLMMGEYFETNQRLTSEPKPKTQLYTIFTFGLIYINQKALRTLQNLQ